MRGRVKGSSASPAVILLVLAIMGASITACGTLDESLPGLKTADWRTANNQTLTEGEFDVLRRNCELQLSAGVERRSAPAGGVPDVNPAYRPGGQGLINANTTGLASLNPVRGDPLPESGRATPQTLDACLIRNGLHRTS